MRRACIGPGADSSAGTGIEDQEEPMVDFLLRAEEVDSAPREVKDWLASLLDRQVAGGTAAAARREPGPILAECSVEEAARVLDLLQSDYLACQVFFELGRDEPAAATPPWQLHRIGLDQILHHVRLADARHLVACLEKIAGAYRTVHPEGGAALFGLDERGGCYVHPTTRQSIHRLWQALVTDHLRSAGAWPQAGMPAGPGTSMPGAAPAAGAPQGRDDGAG
jgi:hypothetical protein